jgi:hypothetical protein
MRAARTIVLELPFLLAVSLVVLAAPNRDAVGRKLPKKMAEEVSADTGQPVIFQRPGPLVWGLSTKTVAHREPIPVLLWLYNPTNKTQSVLTCNDIDWFWSSGIDVFDFSGQRMLTVLERQQMQDPHIVKMFLCSRNFNIDIPPHTCMHGRFSQPIWSDFGRDLREYYSLPPGRYVIVPSETDQAGNPVARTISNPQNALRFEVE